MSDIEQRAFYGQKMPTREYKEYVEKMKPGCWEFKGSCKSPMECSQTGKCQLKVSPASAEVEAACKRASGCRSLDAIDLWHLCEEMATLLRRLDAERKTTVNTAKINLSVAKARGAELATLRAAAPDAGVELRCHLCGKPPHLDACATPAPTTHRPEARTEQETIHPSEARDPYNYPTIREKNK